MKFFKTTLFAIVLAGAIGADGGAALAQTCGAQNPNCVVPTAPPSDSSKRAANTAWTQALFSPITTPENANYFFAGPASGSAAAPAFRALVTADLPTVPLNKGGLGGDQSGATANQVPLYPGSGGAAVPTTITPSIIGSLGSGVGALLGTAVGSAGGPLAYNGAGGEPSSINLTNGTLLPLGGITGFGTAVATFLASPTWTNFVAMITGQTPAAITVKQSWTAAQRGTPTNIAISTATFTPNFDTAQNFEIDLTSACPCTLANPSTTLVAGQSGMIEVHQDGSGSRTIGTWGSDYQYVGGTSTITLSTTASAVDYLPYYVNNAATGIVLGGLLKAPAH